MAVWKKRARLETQAFALIVARPPRRQCLFFLFEVKRMQVPTRPHRRATFPSRPDAHLSVNLVKFTLYLF